MLLQLVALDEMFSGIYTMVPCVFPREERSKLAWEDPDDRTEPLSSVDNRSSWLTESLDWAERGVYVAPSLEVSELGEIPEW